MSGYAMAISTPAAKFHNSGVEHDNDTPATSAKRAPRFLLLIPDELRAALQRSATANARSLSAEINLRLRASVKADADDVPTLVPSPLQGGLYVAEKPPAAELSSAERQMLGVFNTMAPDKQLALLTLLRK